MLKDMEYFKMKLQQSEAEKLRETIYKYYGRITDIFLTEIGLQGKLAALPVDSFRVFCVRNSIEID